MSLAIKLTKNEKIQEAVDEAFNSKRWWTRLVFWSAAALLGVLAVFLGYVCEWAAQRFMQSYETSPYAPFLICPLGIWFARGLQTRFFKESSGSGVPQVMASLRTRSNAVRERMLSPFVIIGKALSLFLAFLFGASVGREGPSVHIGAALFHSLSRFARFSKFERKKVLVVAGASAGIAAAFNTPLAGIVFAIEELKGSFEERTNSLMLTAVIISGLVAIAIVGHRSFLGAVPGSLDSLQSLTAVFAVAIFSGALGGLFSRILLFTIPRVRDFLETPKNRLANHLWPIGLGLLIAALGFLSAGQSFGSGYIQTKELLAGTLEQPYLFAFYKFLATILSYMTGLAGGIFSPSLSIGAGLGFVLEGFFTGVSGKALILLGMVSYLSGVTRTPVTAFVIVFEMTENHLMLLPLMAASFVAAGASRLVCEKSFYDGMCEFYMYPRRIIRLDDKPEGTQASL